MKNKTISRKIQGDSGIFLRCMVDLATVRIAALIVHACYAFVRVCLFVPCGHLLGKGWYLGSCLWCITMSLSLSRWYPGSDLVLDCIDYWSLHPCLLYVRSSFVFCLCSVPLHCSAVGQCILWHFLVIHTCFLNFPLRTSCIINQKIVVDNLNFTKPYFKEQINKHV